MCPLAYQHTELLVVQFDNYHQMQIELLQTKMEMGTKEKHKGSALRPIQLGCHHCLGKKFVMYHRWCHLNEQAKRLNVRHLLGQETLLVPFGRDPSLSYEHS